MTSLRDYKQLPVVLKRWLINRINQEIKTASENGQGSKSLTDNTPDIRALSGRTRTDVGQPKKLQRFT